MRAIGERGDEAAGGDDMAGNGAGAARAAGAPARLQRATGRGRIAARAGARLAALEQSGCVKIRRPRRPEAPGALEAVLLNTAGGLTGGDVVEASIEAEAGAWLAVAPQTAERVYRAASGAARFTLRLRAAAGARVEWLGQETILFDGGRLERRIEIDLAEDARMTLLEPLILGRRAMGEVVRRGSLRERWRLRRGGRLIFAEATALEAPIDALIARPAAAAGKTAMATLLYAGPDAAERLEPVRAALAAAGRDEKTLEAGASLADDRLVVARMLAADGRALRRAAHAAAGAARRAPPPRVWSL